MSETLYFQKDGKDIEHGIELKCTKAIWSCYDVYHNGMKIAELMFGKPTQILDGYSWDIREAQSGE